jgi:hypothetical protein
MRRTAGTIRSTTGTVLAALALVASGVAAADDPALKTDAPAAPAAAPAEHPAPAAKAAESARPAKPATTDSRRFKTVDKMVLDPTAVTGNRELPKVLYIVPWKKSDLGDLVGKPMNSLVDEVLAPVDRDVFKRQLRYYGALQPDRPAGAAAAESKPEK